MRLATATMAVLFFALTACGGSEKSKETSASSTSAQPTTTTASDQATTTTASAPARPAAPFAVTSPAFGDNTQIPAEYSCNGRNVPPPLRWENPPPGTESLALIVDDPDAVGGHYIHWVVTGIAPTATEIVDGALPQGAQVSLNSGGKAAYLGPCPPAGTGVHHYRFQLYALSKPLVLAPTTPAGQATQTIAGAAIATASTLGLFSG
jgi:Raf kinase inhibitor-like YbhB/YbcL family protein